MCDPLTIAGIATMLAGTGMSEYAGFSENQAMNNAAGAELERQRGYQQKGIGEFEQSLAQSTPAAAQQQRQAGTQSAMNEYQKMAQVPSPTTQSYGDPSATQNKINQAGSQATVAGRGAAAAPMQGVQDWQLQQYIKDLQANSGLQQNMLNAQRSEQVLPLELQQAQQSMQGLSGIGSLVSTAGGLMGLYGALNAVPSAATQASVSASLAQGPGFMDAASGQFIPYTALNQGVPGAFNSMGSWGAWSPPASAVLNAPWIPPQ